MARAVESSPHVHVAAAILTLDHRILAAERSYGSHRGFEFPGGKVEKGETPLDACRRELREELGIEISGPNGAESPRFLERVTYRYDDFDLAMDVFLASPASGETINATEHTRLLWLAKDEIFSVPWLPADVELLQRITANWDELIDQ